MDNKDNNVNGNNSTENNTHIVNNDKQTEKQYHETPDILEQDILTEHQIINTEANTKTDNEYVTETYTDDGSNTIYKEDTLYSDNITNKQASLHKTGLLQDSYLIKFVYGVVFGIITGLLIMFLLNPFINWYKSSDNADNDIAAVELLKEPNLDMIETPITRVVDNAMPSVVSITNLSIQEVKDFFFGTVQQYENESSGSGVIIGKNIEELLVLTNNHVISGNTSLSVQFFDGEVSEAIVKGVNSDIDIAIISIPLSSIKEDTLNSIRIAKVVEKGNLNVGEPVIAIGNALGYGQSVTSGIISALDKELNGLKSTLIQTDAAINPGNSGGALLNIRGELIGINTAKIDAEAVEGMGYAISISEVKDKIQELANKKTREKVDEENRGSIGIKGTDISQSSASVYGMPTGVYIAEVIDGAAADNAGINKGSIIVSFDGNSIQNMKTLKTMLQYYEAGETVKIEVAVLNGQEEYEYSVFDVELSGTRKGNSINI